ncbi:Na+/H+ antiporter subunit D, partial [Methanosarcinales archaeon]
MTIEWIHPGLILIFGALLIPFIRNRKLKQAYFLLLPIIALIDLLMMQHGSYWNVNFMEYELVLGRVDRLSMVFAYVFVIAAICMNIYALHLERDWEHVSAMMYAGAGLGAVFAGDLFTLYIFWEVMAWASLFLIWFRGTKAAHNAGFR